MSDFKGAIFDLSDGVLEYAWLLQREIEFDKFQQEARKIAHSLDTSPHETAQFFKEFNEYRSYRGLLHQPAGRNNGKLIMDDDSEFTFAEIIGYCQKALDKYTLPNGLYDRTTEILRLCNTWAESHTGLHPMDLESEILYDLRQYRFDMRFDLTSDRISRNDEEKSLDMIARIKPEILELEKLYQKPIQHPTRFREIRTFTKPVKNAILRLLGSMAQHSKSNRIYLRGDRHELQPPFSEIVIHIYDENSQIDRDANLAHVLKGDMQGVLHQLRGYARWTIEAPFADGASYRFDVMTNTRSGPLDQQVSGVRHTLTFYQYDRSDAKNSGDR